MVEGHLLFLKTTQVLDNVNHLCTLYLYSFLAVVYRGPHGRLALFAKCVTL